MADTIPKAISTLLDTICSYVDAKVSNASYDVSKRGFITSVSNGVYSVKINSDTYDIKSSATYAVGDTVWVTFAQNDVKNRFIVCKI